MSLALLDFDAGTRAELLDFLTAELAPSGEGRRVEIDALVLRDVGVSLLDESLNLLHDLVHIVRCEGVQVDGRAVQPLHHVPRFPWRGTNASFFRERVLYTRRGILSPDERRVY